MAITVLKYLNEHQDGEFHSVDQILAKKNRHF